MTLTETALLTKRAFVVFAGVLFISITGWAGYQYWYNNIRYVPPVEVKPDNKFGLLPQIIFSTNTASPSATSAGHTYSLDTRTGNLPDQIPNIVKVFFIPQLGTTLLAPERARTLANSFSFRNGPELLSNTQYRFTDNNLGEFLIDLNTGNFKYAHKLIATDSAEFQALGPDPLVTQLANEAELGSNFRDFLAGKGILYDQLTRGRTKVTYEKLPIRDSSHARVSIWQNDVEGLPVVTTQFNEGLVRGLITKYKVEEQKFLILDYTYWPVDTNTFATYYIKKVEDAYEELKAGKGIVLVPPIKEPVSITSVYLAYILGDAYNPFLQPVFVFEGPEVQPFAAVVPAVTDDLIKKN